MRLGHWGSKSMLPHKSPVNSGVAAAPIKTITTNKHYSMAQSLSYWTRLKQWNNDLSQSVRTGMKAKSPRISPMTAKREATR
jgi:hypothetical protein